MLKFLNFLLKGGIILLFNGQTIFYGRLLNFYFNFMPHNQGKNQFTNHKNKTHKARSKLKQGFGLQKKENKNDTIF